MTCTPWLASLARGRVSVGQIDNCDGEIGDGEVESWRIGELKMQLPEKLAL
jgi:hypothetical protein